jgi:hypothetical protein
MQKEYGSKKGEKVFYATKAKLADRVLARRRKRKRARKRRA